MTRFRSDDDTVGSEGGTTDALAAEPATTPPRKPVPLTAAHNARKSPMSSELQAAYQVSCLTHDYDPDRQDIAAIVDAGKFTIVTRSIAYCRFTDAMLPNTNRHVCHAANGQPLSFDTLAEAIRAAEDMTACSREDEDDDRLPFEVVGPGVTPETQPRIGAMIDNTTIDTDCPF